MCLPRGTVPAPSHLCRSGVLASPAPAPSQPLKDPRLTGAPPLWYLLRALRRGRAPQDSTEGSVSDACGLLRLCRRSGTPRGIPAAEAVLRALTFSALGAPSGNRKGGKIGRFSAAGHTQNTLYFGPSVLSCISVFDRKKHCKKVIRITFCPAGMRAAPLSPAVDNCL